MRMQMGMEEAEALEREQMWLKKHGSPLTVMGLPDHAELPEVRARYRNLILETHPDTTPHPGAAGNNESEYAILQTAYRMSTQPLSLWHRNGSSPVLYRQLLEQSKGKVRRFNKITVFAVLSYLVMALIGLFFSFVVVTNGLEAALQIFDPEFYQFMVKQEKEEARKRELGEEVDTDPKRLAPSTVRKLLYPGRYIHGDEDPK
ncbi:chaperone protein DNAJ [Angomonas deanei]|uniref:DnaJ domain containing protein, putative n=1 Tax=Angomonas deanei TaxID=59799 RepID=A0A7G2CTL8_9TRYP|nr:chaperone protein DNAJ [Angomonas deanei]CAD2221783.1 DnaJ domain containing protein, putative [Angomonas deanei]|eukprot:EPY37429.1 chaperone protein DNAJ [Angomonas deanei]